MIHIYYLCYLFDANLNATEGKIGEETEEGTQIIQYAIKCRNKESVITKQKKTL